ncbi:flagellar biosynthetic protein FliQ [Ameyamaea chiangmaiensis NBRC 103196]|uniref:Flagellar biosynthetic protein FliQ n=1 Tax=Ameyamaea chiangmaiensis TaxID=442969 RepID=A0A850PA51_9PROT|nr:flagellar biosynthetic protein FliQ [Ameyamaea chiangmaiensis]MBS4075663.1 flagellar biosynthetic protein FliQ [Ameyamaea chiangmaiensis]NVN40914.1 flagellar biosynthetic protein FliQ [Ameyamaea chiangmaiensis]GBQ70603.1 flagellar biosynthetic protein FliQ [Ameyamaea chiangmaiensis NBRC 103196]
MHSVDIASVLRHCFIVVVELSAPALLAALVVGLVVSLFQAVTQINETTLSFVPKVLAVGCALLVAAPFMYGTLQTFTLRAFDMLVEAGVR